MYRLIPVILLLAGSCTIQAPERKRPTEAGADIYGGKVYGIYEPLKVEQDERKIEISGETFTYLIDKSTGQIVSAKALGTEFVAAGSSFPNPYFYELFERISSISLNKRATFSPLSVNRDSTIVPLSPLPVRSSTRPSPLSVYPARRGRRSSPRQLPSHV